MMRTGWKTTSLALAVLALSVPVMGFGEAPTRIALFLYGLLPIFENTLVGLSTLPPAVVETASAMGMTGRQRLLKVELPLAMPGILTGTIIGLAQALGETAPLLLIGMVAFVRDFPGAPPEGLFDPASALPVQIYNWTQRGDPGFVERASGAIIVLLVFLIAMNAVAIYFRRKFERRW